MQYLAQNRYYVCSVRFWTNSQLLLEQIYIKRKHFLKLELLFCCPLRSFLTYLLSFSRVNFITSCRKIFHFSSFCLSHHILLFNNQRQWPFIKRIHKALSKIFISFLRLSLHLFSLSPKVEVLLYKYIIMRKLGSKQKDRKQDKDWTTHNFNNFPKQLFNNKYV